MMGFLTFLMVLVFAALVLVGGLQWISTRQRDGLPRADRERIDRIESALSVLDSRLDDLQDQQRFLERLLADRPEPPAIGRDDAEAAGTASESGDLRGQAPNDGVDSILFETGEEKGRGDR